MRYWCLDSLGKLSRENRQAYETVIMDSTGGFRRRLSLSDTLAPNRTIAGTSGIVFLGIQLSKAAKNSSPGLPNSPK